MYGSDGPGGDSGGPGAGSGGPGGGSERVFGTDSVRNTVPSQHREPQQGLCESWISQRLLEGGLGVA